MQKCLWCNKQSDELKEFTVSSKDYSGIEKQEKIGFVCPEHELKLKSFYKRVERYKYLFLAFIIIICIFTLPISGVFMDKYSFGFLLFCGNISLLGLVVIIFPFCTPQTIERYGVQKSIIVARIMGMLFFIIEPIAILKFYNWF